MVAAAASEASVEPEPTLLVPRQVGVGEVAFASAASSASMSPSSRAASICAVINALRAERNPVLSWAVVIPSSFATVLARLREYAVLRLSCASFLQIGRLVRIDVLVRNRLVDLGLGGGDDRRLQLRRRHVQLLRGRVDQLRRADAVRATLASVRRRSRGAEREHGRSREREDQGHLHGRSFHWTPFVGLLPLIEATAAVKAL